MSRHVVDVITPTYNRPKDIVRTCEMLAGQPKEGLSVRHVVVFDCPQAAVDAALAERVDRFPDTVVLFNEGRNQRYGGPARDIAIERSTADILLFLDDDNLIRPHWLPTLVSACQGHDLVIAPVQQRMGFFTPKLHQPLRRVKQGQLDSLGLAVARERVGDVRWADCAQRDDAYNDAVWANRLAEEKLLSWIHVPVVVGTHL